MDPPKGSFRTTVLTGHRFLLGCVSESDFWFPFLDRNLLELIISNYFNRSKDQITTVVKGMHASQ
jgi:hypothetical protein